MRLPPRLILPLLVRTARDWSDDKASRLAASLAFYTALSLAPLVVIVVGIIGLVYGESTARGEILAQVRALLGEQGVETVATVLEHSEERGSGAVATAIGFGVLLFGASGVFAALQDALNEVFDVQPRPGRAWVQVIKERFLSFGMVLVVGFLLLVSLMLSAALTAVADRLDGGETLAWRALQMVVSFGVVTGLFALIFKYIPDVRLRWRDVGLGAAVTALLFVIGKYLLGLYLATGGVGSAYGAAGSLVAMLVWVYYSAQIVFFGAEFTQAYARAIGSPLVPEENAEATDGRDRPGAGATASAGDGTARPAGPTRPAASR